MIVYNYDVDLEVSDTCVRSSLLSWVELSVRGVDGSCAKHLTVESYMDIYACTQLHLLLLVFHHPLSFIPDLNPVFSAILPTAAFLFQDWLYDSPDFYGYS